MIFFHLELTPAKKNLTRLSCLSSRCPTLTPCVRLLNYTSVVMAAITEDTYKEKASFVFFYYIKIQKFERKFLYGTKHWKWYGDMNMTLLSYSHRLSTGVAPGSRLWPWSLCVVFVLFFFFLHKAADGDCILAGMLSSVVFRPGLLCSSKKWEIREVRNHLGWWRDHRTAVANDRKVIQILYIRLWYSTIQYELIAHKKLSEA